MKITQVVAYEVQVPALAGRVNSEAYGPAIFDEVSKWIVEVHTDSGLIGLGESARGTSEGTLRGALGRLAGMDLLRVCAQEPPTVDLAGNDLFAHEHPHKPHRFYERSFNTYEHLALHAALLDLLGKHSGQPVYAVLGGAYRQQVPADTWMGRMTPEDSARLCNQAQKQGYQGAKLKCALEDDNVERAQAIADACGTGFKLTFDPNARFYRYGEAMPMLRRMALVGNIGCMEDPFHKGDLQAYRMLREQGLFAVALHLGYIPELIEAIRQGACDYVNLGGTPWDIRKAGDVCWLAGIATWHSSGVELGVLESLYLHVAAATQSMSRPSDIFGRTIREHNLITNPLIARNGFIDVPQGPGLGVELDRDALDRYTLRKISID